MSPLKGLMNYNREVSRQWNRRCSRWRILITALLVFCGNIGWHSQSIYAQDEAVNSKTLTAAELETKDKQLGELWAAAKEAENAGDFEAATKACKAALELARSLYGAEDYRVTDARQALKHFGIIERLTAAQRDQLTDAYTRVERVNRFKHERNYPAGIELACETLVILENILGAEHPETAATLNNLAHLYSLLPEYAAAEPLYQRALKINEDILGFEHPKTATTLNNLADFYHSRGDFAAAEPLYQRALKIDEKILGAEHPDTASVLNNLATLYHDQANYAAAEPLYQRALKINAKIFGSERPATATSLNNLASLYFQQSNYSAAEPLYQRALEIREKTLGPEHPRTATSLGNLALLYYSQGNYAAAEPLNQRALKICEEALDSENPQTAECLNNLAVLFKAQANYATAELLLQRALKILEKTSGPEHPDTAMSLVSLALLCHAQENYLAAEPLLQRALKIREKTLGLQHPETAKCLSYLGWLYASQANYVASEPLLQQALQILEKALGSEHPNTAFCVSYLAGMYEDQKNYAAAEPLYERALMINEKVFGSEHPHTTTSLNNLRLFQWRHMDERQALVLARSTIESTRKHLEITAAVQSEHQQLLMAEGEIATLHLWLTVTSQDSNASDCWNHVLPWKGITTSRQSLLRRALGHDALFIEYRGVTQQLSTVTLSPPRPPKAPEAIAAWKLREPELRRHWEVEKERLEIAHTDLEKQLATKWAAFAQEQNRQNVTANHIAGALRAQELSTAFVDLQIYFYFGRDARDGRQKEPDEYRLAAFIARPDCDVQRVELGVSEPLLKLIETWTKYFGQGEDGRAAGEQLRKQLWQPLEEKLDGIETVLISPDGALARLPWGALPGAKPDHYLIEERAVAVIPIPQFLPELVQHPIQTGLPESLLCVGDIDYGGDPGQPTDLLSKREALGRNGRDGQFKKFEKLGSAQPEMASIERRFRKAKSRGELTSLDSLNATEAAFRDQAEKHQWLHIITHGYFAPETFKTTINPLDIEKLVIEERRPSPLINPGLLSGLAMSGANHEFRIDQADKDDGILTAMEVSGLDLAKVQTVVLSACETGLGEVAGGEGLLGLQRAFQVAGAKTCVASLWKVNDAATARLMQRFYENLWDKKMGKLAALREAQIWMLRDQGNRGLTIADQPADKASLPPYYWAAFILSGDWR